MSTIKRLSFVENRGNHFDAEKMGIQRVRVKVPTAEVLTLNGTPIEVAPSPGANKAIKVLGMSTEIKDYVSAAYATNVTLQAITDTADQAQVQDAIGLTSTVDGRIVQGVPVTPTGATNKQVIADKPLLLKVATGNPITGNSDVYVYIDYVILDLAD
jgi:hypothetical protein